MEDFVEHPLDEKSFGPSKSISVRAFDAFPKTKPSYQTRTSSGGIWTVGLALISCLLGISEFSRWWSGTTTHAFSVEKGVSHDLQINIDIVIAMKCDDVRINLQDAAGDLVLAGDTLSRAPTNWAQWDGAHALVSQEERRKSQWYEEDDVHDFLGATTKRRKFPKTPSLSHNQPDACRVFGSLDGNKVQGDFHITARGHGYMDFGEHLDHTSFNFSHQFNELSFGPFYPSLSNPLDNTYSTTESHFHKYQYYLSVVPTIYTTDAAALTAVETEMRTNPSSSEEDGLPSRLLKKLRNTVWTNQYAVTEQSRDVSDKAVPGIFMRYDIEPILLTIAEERSGFLALMVRLVNVVSGILVAGGWLFQLSEFARAFLRTRLGGRIRADSSMGFLHGRKNSQDIKGH